MISVATLISLDPGRTTGWARWSNGILVDCGETACVLGDTRIMVPLGDVAVVEQPQFYPGGRNKADVNDLLGLAWMTGLICAQYPAVVLVSPRDWRRGTAAKEFVAERTLARLDESERHIATRSRTRGLHAVDAVGIGLWALGR